MQAKTLTDAQIEAAYLHFESGGPAPKGVKLSSSFTKTMGRARSSDGYMRQIKA